MIEEGISVVFKADTSQLEAGVKKVESQFANINSTAKAAVAGVSKLGDTIETLRGKMEARKQFLLTETDITKVAKFNKEIESLDKEISRLSNAGKKGFDDIGNAVEKSGNPIGRAYTGLQRIANIIPGIGIAGLVAFAAEPIVNYVRALIEARNQLSSLGSINRGVLFSEVAADAAKSAGSDLVHLEVFKQKLNDLNIPASERVRIAKEYNKVADETNKIDTTQIGNLDAINKKIEAQNTLILKRAISVAAMSKITDAANKTIENEVKLQEELSKRGIKDLDEFEKKQAEAARTAPQAFLKDPKGFAQQSQAFKKGLDGIIIPAQGASRAIAAADTAVDALAKKVRKGRDELQAFIASLNGLITVEGLTTKDPKAKQGSKSQFNFFDQFFDVKPDVNKIEKQIDDMAKVARDFASKNFNAFQGLDAVLFAPSKEKTIEAGRIFWDNFQKGIVKLKPPKIDAGALSFVPIIKAQQDFDPTKIFGSKEDPLSGIDIALGEAKAKKDQQFIDFGKSIGDRIASGFGGVFSQRFSAQLNAALARGLTGKNLDAFKEKVAAMAQIDSELFSGLGSAFNQFTQALLSGQNAMQAFGNSMKNMLISVISKLAEAVALAGFLSLITGGAAKGGLSFASAFNRILAAIPGHATGLDYVPRDNYLARLHQGEMVLTAAQAAAFRHITAGMTTPTNVSTPSFAMAAVNGPSQVEVYGRLSGGDIILSNARTKRKQGRLG